MRNVTIIWRIKRYFVKCYVKRLIQNYCDFIVANESKRSNMNIAKAQILKARIEYWKCAFQAWGDYNLFGYRNFYFTFDEVTEMNSEMKEIGFNVYKKYFWKSGE